MPYKRRSSYGRRRPARKFVRKNQTKQLVTGHGPTMLESLASGAGSIATLARAVMPAIMAINTEAKYLDVANSFNPTFAAPTIQNLSLMAQGLTDKTRIGNSLLAKNISIKYSIINTQNISEKVRFLVISDKLQGGTPPTIAQLMEASGTTTLSAINKNYSDRFVILKDRMVCINSDTQDNQGLSMDCGKYFKQLDFHIRYLGTDATNASAGPNQLYIVVWPDVGCTFNLYSRLNYTDN